MFVDVPDILVPEWAMFIAMALVALLFCVSLYQCCINAVIKEELKIKFTLLTATAFEIAFVTTSYLSIYVEQTRKIKLVCHSLLFCILIALSYLGYHSVATPTCLREAIKVKKLWTLASVLHLIWLLFCLFMLIMTHRLFYEQIYFFGLSLYLIWGTLTVLYLTHHVRRTIMNSIQRFHKLSIQMSRSPAANTATPQTPNGEGHPATLTVCTTVDQKRPSAQCVNPVVHLIRFQKAKKQIHAVIVCAVVVLCIAMFSFFWRLFTFHPHPQKQHCVVIKRPPIGPKGDVVQCRRVLSFTPVDEIGIFIFHYVCVLTVYIAMIHRYWRKRDKVKPEDSVWFKVFPCCLSASMRRRIAANPVATSVPLDVVRKPQKQQPHKPPAADLDEDANRRVTDFCKQATETFVSLDELDHAAHPELYAQVSAVDATINRSSSEIAKDGKSIWEYSHYSGVGGLSTAHIECNLNNLDEKGRIIGKRGTIKVKKLDAEEIERRKKEDRNSAIIERMDSPTSLNCLPLNRGSNAARSITALSMTERNKDVEAETSPLRAPVAGTDLIGIMEEIEMPDLLEPVSTVVLELEYVLCTKAADKLKDKMVNFIEQQDEFKKKLYFGGEERLNVLKQWLANGVEKHSAKYYIVTNEQTKMVVTLLQDVGLLRYFVSINPANRKKLLSHVIGYDHKMSKQASGKRHLILLELLQFLQKPHASVLYVGNEKETVEHIRSIQICKAYHVDSHGLVGQDFDKIQEKYF